MKQYYSLLFLALLLCSACQLKLKPYNQEDQKMLVEVQRYDRLESRYLTTGDFSALQQMNTTYPMETRTLIEDVLDLGEVNEPYINSKYSGFSPRQPTMTSTPIKACGITSLIWCILSANSEVS